MLKSSWCSNLVILVPKMLSAFTEIVIIITNCKNSYHIPWKIAQLFQNYLIVWKEGYQYYSHQVSFRKGLNFLRKSGFILLYLLIKNLLEVRYPIMMTSLAPLMLISNELMHRDINITTFWYMQPWWKWMYTLSQS